MVKLKAALCLQYASIPILESVIINPEAFYKYVNSGEAFGIYNTSSKILNGPIYLLVICCRLI